jgi:hypothetical protein
MTLSTIERSIILTSALFGSVVIFSISLNSINKILIERYTNRDRILDYVNLDKLVFMNLLTMTYSGVVFGYFTYNATK